MGQYDYLHEVESVAFNSTDPRPMGEVHNILSALGFHLHEDVYSLDRKPPVPPWEPCEHDFWIFAFSAVELRRRLHW